MKKKRQKNANKLNTSARIKAQNAADIRLVLISTD